MSRVHYLSFYLAPGEERRASVPAGFAKVEYIADSLTAAGVEVRMVSTAIALKGYEPSRTEQLGSGRELVHLPSLRLPGRAGYAIAMACLWVQMVRYLLLEVHRGDVVLAYHSLTYLRPFAIARRLRPFHLVLEFNDLYSAVSERHRGRRAEEEAFIVAADRHLVMNRLAARRFSRETPHLISYGSYTVPARRRPQADDGRVHAVYAGVIESGRRAAELSVRAAAHLDAGFVVHVLGFGAQDEVDALRALAQEVNQATGREAVIFHGQLRGEEFTDFLHGCHVGLSTHSYSAADHESADFTFPSKIPVYAAHELWVVTPDIGCVVDSPFAECASFYSEHEPPAIAAAIRASAEDLTRGQSPASVVTGLDEAFRRDIGALVAYGERMSLSETSVPSRWHRCRPEHSELINLEVVDGCRCGAVRVNNQQWVGKNSRRRPPATDRS
jgi:hypothetical protein